MQRAPSEGGCPPRGRGRLPRRQVGGERRHGLGVVRRVVGELDRDGLGRPLGDGPVELRDGPLGLNALVEADEADALGQALGKSKIMA